MLRAPLGKQLKAPFFFFFLFSGSSLFILLEGYVEEIPCGLLMRGRSNICCKSTTRYTHTKKKRK